jgi:hypothetical protein
LVQVKLIRRFPGYNEQNPVITNKFFFLISFYAQNTSIIKRI